MKINMPDDAKLIIRTLEDNGFECFAVGGCIRDSILEKTVNDWDFTTSATPDEILKSFDSYTTVDIGKKYGTICVVVNGKNYEITTYRTEDNYSDSRHPDSVSFSKNLLDDLSRRDFTVNAMAYNDSIGLVDEYGGIDDLKLGVIRCIGDPDVRFSEDALRILRALRFASVYGFSIESNTSQSILRNRNNLSLIAPERINKEFSKLLCGNTVDFILRRYKDVIAVFIPEITCMFSFDQNNKHHNKDLWRHTVSAVKNTTPDEILRIAMLLHDIGKPMTVKKDAIGVSHFPQHQKLSSAMATTILKRLRFPSYYLNDVRILIEHHDDRLEPDRAMIKRYMRDLGSDIVSMLLDIQRADILAQSSYKRVEKLNTLDEVHTLYLDILNNDECYSLDTLAVNGKDIIHLGVQSGEKIGLILNTLLDKVIDDEVENNKEELVACALTLI